MANNLYITEYSELASVPNNHKVMAGQEPKTAGQKIAFTTTTPSSAFNNNTKFVMVHAEAICSIKFGGSAITATTSDDRLIAGETRFYGVVPGGYLAVVSNT